MSNDNIEDIYPLSATQTGIFFHHLHSPQQGLYFNQYSCTLTGQLDKEHFAKSWQLLIDRHSILRSCFLWQGLENALQVVKRQVSLPWQFLDWHAISSDQQQLQLSRFLQKDRLQGFALDKAPVFRITLIQLAAEQYQLVWSFHHIILDRWSVELLLEELFAYYFNFPALPKAPDYREFINYLKQRNVQAEKQFWQHYLTGINSTTKLLTRVDVVPGSGSNKCMYTLKANSYLMLQQTARAGRLTINTFLQGAWAILLNYYSGESDVLFGHTVSGRPTGLAGVEQMIGLFINTLPVRITVQQQTGLGDWLLNIQNQQLTTHPYENASLLEIQAGSELKNDSALFDTLLVFENIPANKSILQKHPELRVDNVEQIERSHYPLALILCPGDCLDIHAIYDEQHFNQQTIKDILQQFSNVLVQMTDNLDQKVAELSLLNTTQSSQLFQLTNQTHLKHPQYQTIQQLISEQVADHPGGCALRSTGQNLSYQELESQSNSLANFLLLQKPVGTAPLAILLPRCSDYIIAILAALKVGIGYLPLNPEDPEQRIRELIKGVNASLLLTNNDYSEQFAQLPETPILLIAEWRMAGVNGNAPPDALSPQAYFIYTSGSTGKPKAVKLTQQNLLHSTQARLSYYPEPVQRFLLLPSFSFDSSVAGIFWTLAQGGMLCLPETGAEKDPQQLCTKIAEDGITHLLLLPSLYQLILKHATDGQLGSLNTVIVAGEVCPIELPQLHYQQLPDVPLFNEYGPTEATVWSSVYKIPVNTQESSIAIGQPIANTQIYLLAENNQPVPQGVIGEICIAGAGVATGYYQAEAVTTENFIINPFSSNPDNRLYKTGDLGRYRMDGNIEFLGRKDQQIKFLGYRIEPEEIQAIINQYPGIDNSIVIEKKNQGIVEGLIAYLLAKELQLSEEKSKLQDYLRNYLPHYMVPAYFIVLTEFPLNTNGKINRNALPPLEQLTSTANDLIAPRNLTEQQLAEIWQELFQTDLISIDDDFFELGGHSLLAVSLVDKISTAFQKKITLASLWKDAATIRTMAEYIDQQQLSEISMIKRVPRSTDKL